MRLGYDLSILRHPYAGTARYAEELLAAMIMSAARDERIVPAQGFPRLRRGGRLRRYLNLASDLTWLTAGIGLLAVRHRLDAWFSPANILPLLLPRPAVVTIHDVNFLDHPETYDRAYARYARLMFRRSAARAAFVMTDSEYARGRIVERLDLTPDRVVVAYPGLDHRRLAGPAAPDPDMPARYALFTGQTEPHKNVGLLLDAWRVGVPDDLHLVIAGPPGRDDVRLRAVVAASPELRERVHFLGSVDESRLARLYADAACFLFPSRTEGFGFPPLEAMSHGVPTAVAAAASLPEVTGAAALHFEPDDAPALATVVRRLVEDGELRERLRRDGVATAARFRWNATAAVAWRAVRQAVGRD